MSSGTLIRTVAIIEPFSCSSHSHLVKWLNGILNTTTTTTTGSNLSPANTNTNTILTHSSGTTDGPNSPPNVINITLPGKKWHWRMRSSSLYLAQQIPLLLPPLAPSSSTSSSPTTVSPASLPSFPLLPLLMMNNNSTVTSPMTLFVSSMCNLSELLSLRPDLIPCRKIYYFHENQLTYPSNKENTNKNINQERDFHFGWIQFLSCLVADIVAWNSSYNLESFLTALPSFLKTVPDKQQYPLHIDQLILSIRNRSIILPLPIDPVIQSFPEYSSLPLSSSSLSSASSSLLPPKSSNKLRIGWNHRWEYDKNPDLFFSTLAYLQDKRYDFEVVILGEKFAEFPTVFTTGIEALQSQGKLVHAGFVPDRATYVKYLSTCDIAISTATHEFFGVSMLEAMSCGVFPLSPCDLAYPEVFAPTVQETERYESIDSSLDRLLQPFVPQDNYSLSSTTPSVNISSTSSSSSSRPSNPIYHPHARESEYLYATEKQLRNKLEYFVRNPWVLHQWRQNLFPVLFPDNVIENINPKDTMDDPSKRRKLDPVLSASSALVPPPVPSRWMFSTTKLAPLYRKLLL